MHRVDAVRAGALLNTVKDLPEGDVLRSGIEDLVYDLMVYRMQEAERVAATAASGWQDAHLTPGLSALPAAPPS